MVTSGTTVPGTVCFDRRAGESVSTFDIEVNKARERLTSWQALDTLGQLVLQVRYKLTCTATAIEKVRAL